MKKNDNGNSSDGCPAVGLVNLSTCPVMYKSFSCKILYGIYFTSQEKHRSHPVIHPSFRPASETYPDHQPSARGHHLELMLFYIQYLPLIYFIYPSIDSDLLL